eukprot:TRINITY_DN10408_c0_g3_i2.p2 TRINITY_DN10408_c0_g3~~TRINITY_DN10408_c0_g3_i2.p2  ORF type:complete len:200 (+),score=51.88 TRINITY_DN10408_c0_g3_i2:488-1087(+)
MSMCGKLCLGISAVVCLVIGLGVGGLAAWQIKIAMDESNWDEQTCIWGKPVLVDQNSCTYFCDEDTMAPNPVSGNTCSGVHYDVAVTTLKCLITQLSYDKGSMCLSPNAKLTTQNCWVNNGCTKYDLISPDDHRKIGYFLAGGAGLALLCALVCVCVCCQSSPAAPRDTLVYSAVNNADCAPGAVSYGQMGRQQVVTVS